MNKDAILNLKNIFLYLMRYNAELYKGKEI